MYVETVRSQHRPRRDARARCCRCAGNSLPCTTNGSVKTRKECGSLRVLVCSTADLRRVLVTSVVEHVRHAAVVVVCSFRFAEWMLLRRCYVLNTRAVLGVLYRFYVSEFGRRWSMSRRRHCVKIGLIYTRKISAFGMIRHFDLGCTTGTTTNAI